MAPATHVSFGNMIGVSSRRRWPFSVVEKEERFFFFFVLCAGGC